MELTWKVPLTGIIIFVLLKHGCLSVSIGWRIDLPEFVRRPQLIAVIEDAAHRVFLERQKAAFDKFIRQGDFGHIHLAALGKNLRKLALLNVYKAQYLKSKLLQLPGWKDVFSAPGYNEFVVTCPDAQAVNEKLEQECIIGGYELAPDYPELESALLFCATELVLKEDIDQIVRILK